MKERDRKLLFKVFFVIAIILTIISFLTPIITFDLSDVYEKNGLNNYRYIWKAEEAFLYRHYKSYDYTFSKNEPVHDWYNILVFRNVFEKGDYIFGEYSDYDNPNLKFGMTNNFVNYITIIFVIIFAPIFLYLLLNSYKSIGTNKSRNYIYLGIILSSALIGSILNVYITYNNLDTQNLGYVEVFNFGIGLYLLIASIIMFFSGYFLQSYFLDSE